MLSGNEARAERLPERARVATVLEIAACVLLFGAGLQALGRYLAWMGTTSLWTDELHTILHYSGHGPLVTLTTYKEPNNHIFFNLVNSLTPGRQSVDPLRARIWSFLAFLATLGIGVGFFARRRALAFGALLFAVLAAQPELLDLVLQARGYSFLCLFGLLAAVLTITLFQRVETRWLISLGLVSIAGAWTVPVFGFFIAPLWLLLVLALRRKEVLAAASATGLGILVVYAPVSAQLLYQVRHYDERWGRQYAHLAAVRETLETYLLHSSWTGLGLGIGGAVAASIAGGAVLILALLRDSRKAVPGAVLLAAVGLFFSTCLALQTPLIRSTAFIAVPLAFAAVYLLWVASPRPPLLGRVAFLAVAMVLAFQARKGIADSRFLPFEQWQEMAATLRDSFPEGTRFHVNEKADFLGGYLSPGYVPDPGIDVGMFARGEELYLDTPVEDPPGKRVDARGVVADAVEFRIPQRRAGYQALWFCPPGRSFLTALRTVDGSFLAQVTDRSLATGTGRIGAGASSCPWTEIELETGRRYRSVILVLVVAEGAEDRPSISAFGRSSERVPVGPVRRSRNVVLVGLRDQEVTLLTVRGPAGSGRLPSIQEVWAYPSPGRPGS